MNYLLALILSFMPATAFAAADTYGDDVSQAKDGGSLPQFNLETFSSQTFWLFVTFFFIYFFVKNMILPQMSSTISMREDHIRHELQEAGALNEKARFLQNEYEMRIRDAHNLAQEKAALAHANVSKKLSDLEAKQREIFSNKRSAFIGSYKAQRIKIKEELEVEAKVLSKMLASKLSETSPEKSSKKAA